VPEFLTAVLTTVTTALVVALLEPLVARLARAWWAAKPAA
jgi:phage gp46-like protein